MSLELLASAAFLLANQNDANVGHKDKKSDEKPVRKKRISKKLAASTLLKVSEDPYQLSSSSNASSSIENLSSVEHRISRKTGKASVRKPIKYKKSLKINQRQDEDHEMHTETVSEKDTKQQHQHQLEQEQPMKSTLEVSNEHLPLESSPNKTSFSAQPTLLLPLVPPQVQIFSQGQRVLLPRGPPSSSSSNMFHPNLSSSSSLSQLDNSLPQYPIHTKNFFSSSLRTCQIPKSISISSVDTVTTNSNGSLTLIHPLGQRSNNQTAEDLCQAVSSNMSISNSKNEAIPNLPVISHQPTATAAPNIPIQPRPSTTKSIVENQLQSIVIAASPASPNTSITTTYTETSSLSSASTSTSISKASANNTPIAIQTHTNILIDYDTNHKSYSSHSPTSPFSTFTPQSDSNNRAHSVCSPQHEEQPSEQQDESPIKKKRGRPRMYEKSIRF